jgi:hypothetical protein
MEELRDGQLLRIIIGEDDTFEGQPLYQAILLMLRREGLAGASVFHGTAGFGASSIVHTSKVLRLSQDLPVLIECVDTAAKIDAVVPILDSMIDEGLMTIERTDVRVYRGRSG